MYVKFVLYIFLMLFLKKKGYSKYVIKIEKNILYLY